MAWPELLGRTGRLLGSANRTTRPAALLDLCDRVHALGMRPMDTVTTWSPPLWTEGAYQVPAPAAICEAALALIDEWNRIADRPVSFPHFMMTYEEYTEHWASSDWLQEGLGWLWEAVGNWFCA